MPSPRFIERMTDTTQRRAHRQSRRQHEGQQRETSDMRRQIGQLRGATNRHAHNADASEQKHREATTNLTDLEQDHSRFADLTIEWAVVYWVVFATIPVVYLIDTMLFFQTAVTVARYAFTSRLWMVTVACYVIPAVFLGIEIGVASQMYAARHQAPGTSGNGSYTKWLIIGLTLMIVMPGLVMSTHPALALWDSQDHLSRLLTWQLIGFVALVIVTHFFVIFGGDTAHDAKAHAVFNWRRWRLRRTIRTSEIEGEREGQAAMESFADYLHQLDGYSQLNSSSHLAGGPFDAITRDLINERYGYEIIAAPQAAGDTSGTTTNGNALPQAADNGGAPSPGANAGPTPPDATAPGAGNGGPAASPQPSPPAGSNGHHAAAAGDDASTDGVEDYLRMRLNREVLDSESEARN